MTEQAERNRPRLPENDRREIAKRIFDALCAKFPEKYVALVQPRGDPNPPDRMHGHIPPRRANGRVDATAVAADGRLSLGKPPPDLHRAELFKDRRNPTAAPEARPLEKRARERNGSSSRTQVMSRDRGIAQRKAKRCIQ